MVKTKTSAREDFPRLLPLNRIIHLPGWIQTLARLDVGKTNDQYRERRKLPLFQRNDGKFSWTFPSPENFSTWPFPGKFRKNYRNPTSWGGAPFPKHPKVQPSFQRLASQETTTHQVEGEADDFRHCRDSWLATLAKMGPDFWWRSWNSKGQFFIATCFQPRNGNGWERSPTKIEIGRFSRKKLQVMAERFEEKGFI